MKFWIKMMALALSAVVLWGCTPQTPSTADGTADTTGTNDTDTTGPGSTPMEVDEETLYNQLFDADYKVELNLRMSEAEISKLQQDYEYYSNRGAKSPIYRMADLDVTITAPDGTVSTYTIEQVGVRMKGNTSRTSFYNADDGIYNLIHLKLSFKETFDDEQYYGKDALVWADEESREARKDRTFATLEKLDMRWNKCNDGTYIRESYAYEMFRDNGVIAPHTTLAGVDWAGEHMGVFTLCEPVDKVFLKRNLPKDMRGGDLYKCGWTSTGADFQAVTSIGIEDDDNCEYYTYDLKTNKKTSDHSSLVNFITALNSGDITKESLADLVDMDNFLSFAAVTYLLGNPDDARNNYNNFYIYFPPEGGCLLIPTDYDRCLGVTHEWDPTGDALTTDDPFGTAMATGSTQESPLYLYTVCQGGYYVAEFAQRLQEIADSKWCSNACFESAFSKAESLYGDLTAPSKGFYNCSDHHNAMTLTNADGNTTFQDYMRAKLATLKNAISNLDAAVNPQIPSHIYIRAEFTNWDVWPDYAMEKTEDGCYRFVVNGGTFKVYDKAQNQWYGAEQLAENTSVGWTTDGHGNIILPQGQYLVIFDPQTQIITISSF